MLDIALKVLNIIEENGYEAYIVGGFVRDYLMKRKSNDIDIATNATPKQLMELFPNASTTNTFYGAVSIYYNAIKFEITTYRVEQDYQDMRHPNTVIYATNLADDIKRRDFTINAICIDKNGKIHDLVNGYEDIKKRKIRTIGDATVSFSKDVLRILRAVRFATTLDFSLTFEVEEAIRQTKYLLTNLSLERKKEELNKIFSSNNLQKGLDLLRDLGLDKELGLQRLSFVKNIKQVIGIWTVLEVDDLYPFTRNELQLMKEIRLAIKDNPLCSKTVYKYDLYVCSVALEIMGLDNKYLMDIYENMPIHKRSDIVIDSYDIINSLKIEEGPDLSTIWEKIEEAILNKEVENNKKELLLFIKNVYSKLKERENETTTID